LINQIPGARLFRAGGDAAYDLVDLGPFRVEVTGRMLTGFGTVAGLNGSGAMCGYVGDAPDRFMPVLWSRAGLMTRLPAGRWGGLARDLNGAGTVVGSEAEHDGLRPVAWRNGELIRLPDLAGDVESARGDAIAINSAGVITGDLIVEFSTRAVRWVNDRAEALCDPPGGYALRAFGINDRGTILASLRLYGQTGPVRSFGLWRGDQVTLLDLSGIVPDDLTVMPMGINNRDQVVLAAYESGPDCSSLSAIIITDGVQRAMIDHRAEGHCSFPIDINDAGVVVGQTERDGRDVAALWRDGVMIDLQRLIPVDTELWFDRPEVINNAGMIAGQATDANGTVHGVLLIPA
jgi:probable HAF family extracellular repeat protein